MQKFLNDVEMDEVERLSRDMKQMSREIAADRILLKHFMNQLTVRMDGNKRYCEKEMATVLEELAG